MKKKFFGFSFLLLLFCVAANGQVADTNSPIKISAIDAKKYIGTNVTVSGTIVETKVSERMAWLNFEKPFPNQTFTAVIFGAKTNLFPNLDKYKGKAVEISGTIGEHNGKPQITLANTNQVRFVEKEVEAK